MGYGPPLLVEALPREALPFGLFSVLQFRPSADERWANGIVWESMTCEPASGFEDPSCGAFDADGAEEKFFRGSGENGEAVAFGVYGSHKCGSPRGGRAFAEDEEKATAHLLAREQGQAEARVWARLAEQAEDIHPSGALDPVQALAALERWMGAVYGSQGVIHADRGAVTLLAEWNVSAQGSRLVTNLSTPVVAGGGYPGTSPEGASTPDVSWVFASPALFGYRGEVMNTSALDRRNNDNYALAERQYVVGFDPCGVAAVRMNLA